MSRAELQTCVAEPLPNGTRVTAVIYGKPRFGVVVASKRGGIVFVRWEPSQRIAWAHRESLTVVQS